VGHAAGQQSRQLGHQAGTAAQLARLEVTDIGAGEAHRAPVGIGEAVEEPQERRLTRARGPNESGGPLPDLEVEVG
jgi:hypothetical protein